MPTCVVAFFPGTLDIEPQTLCNYAIYHVFMLVFCGAASLLFMLVAVLQRIAFGSNPNPEQAEAIDRSIKWAVVFLCHTLGFEAPLLLLYLCIVLRVFVSCLRCMGAGVLWAQWSTAAVIPLNVIVTVDTGAECSICLESGGGPWFVAPCQHAFHLGCITKWRNSCPLCRAVVWKQ